MRIPDMAKLYQPIPCPPVDLEIAAMRSMIWALEPLDDAARLRVLAWVAHRFGLSPVLPEIFLRAEARS